MDGLAKFENCENRSRENVVKPIKICCGRTQEQTAYECANRNIFPLSVQHCEYCTEFKQR